MNFREEVLKNLSSKNIVKEENEPKKVDIAKNNKLKKIVEMTYHGGGITFIKFDADPVDTLADFYEDRKILIDAEEVPALQKQMDTCLNLLDQVANVEKQNKTLFRQTERSLMVLAQKLSGMEDSGMEEVEV